MPVDFPNDPAPGATFVVNARTYTWMGDRWSRSAAAPPPSSITLISLSPDWVQLNNASLTVTVQGSLFTAASVVYLDGLAITTQYFSPIVVMFVAPMSATPKMTSVEVRDGAVVSNALSLEYR